MQSTDRAEFVRVLNGLAAVKGKELTKEALEIWWGAMARWTLADFKSAASHLVSSIQWMPSPYDFQQLLKAGELTPSEAWAEVLLACRNWRTPDILPNGRISRAAACVGGFRAIAMADIERDLPHILRRFLDAYAELSDVESVRNALPDIAPPRLGKSHSTGLTQIGDGLNFDDET
jgi:hypothetical protein